MNSWPTKKLGEVTERLRLEKAPLGSWPYIEIGDVDLENKSVILKDKKSIKGAVIAPKDSVLISRVRPTRGAIALIDKNYIVSSAFTVLKARQLETSSRFLFYWLGNLRKFYVYLQSKQKGSNYPSVREKDILNYEIPLPPLKIQKQIVERLDKIVEAQKLNDKLIQKADELSQSLLHKELNPAGKDWEVKNIGEVCKIVGGGTPSREDLKHFKGDIPWVTVKDLHILEIEDTIEHINKESLKNSAANLVPADTILVATRVGLGKIAIAKKPLTFNQDIKGLVANDGVDASYLFYAILKNAGEIVKNGKGATVKGVTQEFLKSIKILLPSLKTQKQIVEKLSAAQDYKTKLFAQRTKLKELFDSVLHKSMYGEYEKSKFTPLDTKLSNGAQRPHEKARRF